ncbi:MAG: hypothetical protein SVR08_11925 [Spirochaetota bacterium]|nr:hypothetical protein [Spirochaetota bacterium]
MTYEIIFSRRHEDLSIKDEIYHLIDDCYIGGQQFIDAEHLLKHEKESREGYSRRLELTPYINNFASLVDLIVGFLFVREPSRKETDNVKYIIDKATKTKGLTKFMQMVAIRSFLYPGGVLVDSPTFDPATVGSEKQRQNENLNPYCVFYTPFKIRDFAYDENNELSWIILDNSYTDKTNPLIDNITHEIYRLWTTNEFIDFERIGKEIVAGQAVEHGLGEVPFKFCMWRDDDDDFISESLSEDLAYIAKANYNNLSYMPEMLSAGTFKMLAYPSASGEIPDELVSGGTGSLTLLPFDGNLSHKPEFIGSELGDVASYLSVLEYFSIEMLKIVGIDTDEAKQYVKSGVAKKLDFQKVKSYLSSGARMLGELETWIFQTVAKWENNITNASSSYETDFLSEDIDEKLARWTQLAMLPYKELQKTLHKIMVRSVLSSDMTKDELEETIESIDRSPDQIDIGSLINMEDGADA